VQDVVDKGIISIPYVVVLAVDKGDALEMLLRLLVPVRILPIIDAMSSGLVVDVMKFVGADLLDDVQDVVDKGIICKQSAVVYVLDEEVRDMVPDRVDPVDEEQGGEDHNGVAESVSVDPVGEDVVDLVDSDGKDPVGIELVDKHIIVIVPISVESVDEDSIDRK
jgi:hypothetical protein